MSDEPRPVHEWPSMELTLAVTAPDGRYIVRRVLLLPGGGHVVVA